MRQVAMRSWYLEVVVVVARNYYYVLLPNNCWLSLSLLLLASNMLRTLRKLENQIIAYSSPELISAAVFSSTSIRIIVGLLLMDNST